MKVYQTKLTQYSSVINTHQLLCHMFSTKLFLHRWYQFALITVNITDKYLPSFTVQLWYLSRASRLPASHHAHMRTADVPIGHTH